MSGSGKADFKPREGQQPININQDLDKEWERFQKKLDSNQKEPNHSLKGKNNINSKQAEKKQTGKVKVLHADQKAAVDQLIKALKKYIPEDKNSEWYKFLESSEAPVVLGAIKQALDENAALKKQVEKDFKDLREMFNVVSCKKDKTIEETARAVGLSESDTAKIMLYAKANFPEFMAKTHNSRNLKTIAAADYEMIYNLLNHPDLETTDKEKVLQVFLIYINELNKKGSDTFIGDLKRKFNIGIASIKDYIFSQPPVENRISNKLAVQKIVNKHMKDSLLDILPNKNQTQKEQLIYVMQKTAQRQAAIILEFMKFVKDNNLDDVAAQCAYKDLYYEVFLSPLKLMFQPNYLSRLPKASFSPNPIAN